MKANPQGKTQADRNRIIRNTLFLYLRMVLVMFVSFFTARITLQVLGVEDFGIQNVVAGVVSFLGVMTGTMTSATQRFFAYDLGRNDLQQYKRTFSTMILVFIVLSLLVFIIGEAFANWLVYDYLVIPSARQDAAYWAYQFAILTFIASMMTIPFTASCIAHEKMDVFGYISIFESIMKLLVVYLLYLSSYDKLISLSILNCVVQYLLLAIYAIYCFKKFAGCKITKQLQKNLLKQILQYTGWNLFGSVSGILCTSGLTIVLNLFFGPLVNAAKSIADKINQFVVQFSNNFFQASAPMIVKSYASGDVQYSRDLVCKCSKFSYYLMYIVTLAIIFVIKDLLQIWLGKKYVTEDMILFTQWILVYSLINVLEPPISQIIRATGDIKVYQVSVGIITLSCIPVSYLAFKLGFAPVWSIIILTIIYTIAHFARLYVAQRQVNLKIREYIRNVFIPIGVVTLSSFTLLFLISSLIPTCRYRIIILPVCSVIISFSAIYFLGLTTTEKELVKNKINQITGKITKH